MRPIIPSETRFSTRVSFGGAQPNALSVLLEEKRAQKVPVADLTASNPTLCGFKANAAFAHELSGDRYDPDPRGSLRAREAVCRYYADAGSLVHPDQVFLCCGTSEAYAWLFHLLCEPGEEVAGVWPVYPLIDHLAAYSGVHVRRIDSFAQLEKAAPSRVLAFVNPANPTGRYVNEEDWKKVEEFCKRSQATILSDEVFFDFDWDPKKRQSGACQPAGRPRDTLCFTLSGVSKIAGLPQMKLAWIVVSGPEKERLEASRRLELIADAFLSVNTPSQNALPAWLAGRHAFIDEVMERVRTNFRTLHLNLDLPVPEGGWYALLPLPKSVSDEEFVLRLLKEHDVLVHPGYFFDLPGENVIVSLLPETTVFEEGAGKLIKELIKLK